jgi:hypothetical protein
MASLKVAVITEELATFADPAAGENAVMVGGVTSGGVTVADCDVTESEETIPDGPFAETAYAYCVSSASPLSV